MFRGDTMGNIKIGIHQPNLFPWLGYFNKIAQSDYFILLDNVQIQKTGASYTNRVSILLNKSEHFITAPIKRHNGIWSIKDTEFSNPRWVDQTIKKLQSAYGRAPHFKSENEFIFDLINFKSSNIASYNINFITTISKNLGLSASLKISSEIPIHTDNPTERLIAIIQSIGGNHYISGNGGASYQEIQLFHHHGIELSYVDNSNITYKQFGSDNYIKGLSILDAIFNLGIEATSQLLKSNKVNSL